MHEEQKIRNQASEHRHKSHPRGPDGSQDNRPVRNLEHPPEQSPPKQAEYPSVAEPTGGPAACSATGRKDKRPERFLGRQ